MKGWTLAFAALLTLRPAAAAADAPPEPPAPDTRQLGPLPLSNPEALYEWGARAKRTLGCTAAESAWVRLVEDAPDSEWAPPAQYHLAVCQEEDQDWEAALAGYDHLLATWPRDPMVKDALFRKGLVLEELGRYREAKDLYRGMLRNLELRLTAADKDACAIQRDIELLYMGKERRAMKRLLAQIEAFEALDRDAQEPRLYWIAKAELVLGRRLSDEARSVPMYLSGGQRLRAAIPGGKSDTEMLAALLDERGSYLLAARGRYQRVIDHDVHEWNLAAIYQLGRDYEDLYRDLIGAPVPPELNAEEAEIYRNAVVERSWPILVKAYRHYVYGDDLARSYRLASPWADRLAEARANLDREGMSPAELEKGDVTTVE